MSTPLTADQIEIADGLMLADLETIEDFEMASLTLTRDIGRIEEQLAGDTVQDVEWAYAIQDVEWVYAAGSALRFKKALRQQITATVADLRRAERAGLNETKAQALVDQFKADWPAQFAISMAAARESRPDLWER